MIPGNFPISSPWFFDKVLPATPAVWPAITTWRRRGMNACYDQHFLSLPCWIIQILIFNTFNLWYSSSCQLIKYVLLALCEIGKFLKITSQLLNIWGTVTVSILNKQAYNSPMKRQLAYIPLVPPWVLYGRIL